MDPCITAARAGAKSFRTLVADGRTFDQRPFRTCSTQRRKGKVKLYVRAGRLLAGTDAELDCPPIAFHFAACDSTARIWPMNNFPRSAAGNNPQWLAKIRKGRSAPASLPSWGKKNLG